MRHYLAYGSNLHPLRILERVPSSRLVGATRLERYTVTFIKRSRDGSAKCNLLWTDNPDDAAYGAVYEMSAAEKHLLDAVEGLGAGYDEARVQVDVNGRRLAAFTYTAATSHLAPQLLPYAWYKSLVTEGAIYHGFPDAYIACLNAVDCQQDSDRERRLRYGSFLVKLRNYGKSAAMA